MPAKRLFNLNGAFVVQSIDTLLQYTSLLQYDVCQGRGVLS